MGSSIPTTQCLVQAMELTGFEICSKGSLQQRYQQLSLLVPSCSLISLEHLTLSGASISAQSALRLQHSVNASALTPLSAVSKAVSCSSANLSLTRLTGRHGIAPEDVMLLQGQSFFPTVTTLGPNLPQRWRTVHTTFRLILLMLHLPGYALGGRIRQQNMRPGGPQLAAVSLVDGNAFCAVSLALEAESQLAPIYAAGPRIAWLPSQTLQVPTLSRCSGASL